MTIPTMVAASLVADSLSLPAHWNYDPAKIMSTYGRITELLPPDPASYHKNQTVGAQTHYGDQALVLLRAIAASGYAFDAETFARQWRASWDGYTGYVDGATKKTLAALEAGTPWQQAGSPSDDLGGGSRIAALVAATMKRSEEDAVKAAWAQTELTHRDPAVCEAAAFSVRAVRAIAGGMAVPEALALAAGAEYVALQPKTHLEAARQALSRGTPVEAVAALGLPCPVHASFPAALALALAYPTDLEAALIDNVMAGGDSAARGLAVGMWLGAVPGARVPERWLAAWKARAEVEAFTKALV